MIVSKKAIQTYLLVIIGISFIVSILLFLTIEVIYEEDHRLCQDISYDYEVVCKQQGGYTVVVENTGRHPLSFEMNGEVDSDFFVDVGSDNRFSVISSSGTAIGVPIVFDENQNSHYCRSRQERTNVEVLSTC